MTAVPAVLLTVDERTWLRAHPYSPSTSEDVLFLIQAHTLLEPITVVPVLPNRALERALLMAEVNAAADATKGGGRYNQRKDAATIHANPKK